MCLNGLKTGVVKKATTGTAKITTSSDRASKEPAKTYTVKKGDTLWNIAKEAYGSGTDWKRIYNANKSIIEATANKYGKSSSSNGWWIYPGTELVIP